MNEKKIMEKIAKLEEEKKHIEVRHAFLQGKINALEELLAEHGNEPTPG